MRTPAKSHNVSGAIDFTHIAILLLLSCLPVFFFGGWYIDDTFIYLQFAKNLINGHGFSFNPGEPVYGVTGPLWTLLIAFLGLFFSNILAVAKVLGFLFGVLATVVIYKLARAATGSSNLALFIGVLWVLDAWWIRTPFSGMEAAAAVFFIYAGFYFYRKECGSENSGTYSSSYLFGLAVLFRPEAILILPLLIVDILRRLGLGSFVKESMNRVFRFMAPVIPWFLYAYFSFGAFMPTTASAKSSGPGNLSAVLETIKSLSELLAFGYAGLLLLVVVSALILIRKGRLSTTVSSGDFLVLYWLLALPLSYLLLGLGGFLTSRYLIMIIPALLIYGVKLVKEAIDSTLSPGSYKNLVLVGLAVLLVAQPLLMTALFIYPSSKKSMNDLDGAWKKVGLWIRAHTPEDSTVALGAIGAIGFYSERRIIDLGALVTPEALPYFKGEKGDINDYIEKVKPDYLVEQELASENPRQSVKRELVFSCPITSGMGLRDTRPLEFRVYRLK